MKQILKRALRRTGRLLGLEESLSQAVSQTVNQAVSQVDKSRDSCASRLSQLLMVEQYRALARSKAPLPDFADVEFRAFSQNGEDGILLYLFALLGAGRRRALEICASNGIQCNAANLVVNHGWEALLMDGDAAHISQGNAFYANHPDTFSFPPRFVHAWITRENVNQAVREGGFEGEIDLLSLDIDGNDYWIWEALNVVSPRVVVAEIQCIWGADRAVTVPYHPEFRAGFVNGFGVIRVQACLLLSGWPLARAIGSWGFNGLASTHFSCAMVWVKNSFRRWNRQIASICHLSVGPSRICCR